MKKFAKRWSKNLRIKKSYENTSENRRKKKNAKNKRINTIITQILTLKDKKKLGPPFPSKSSTNPNMKITRKNESDGSGREI